MSGADVSPCNCDQETPGLIRTLPSLSTPATTPATPTVSLDKTLQLSDRLLSYWELLNGCANADEHCTPSLHRRMTDAVTYVLRLHESFLGEESAAPMEPGQHRDDQGPRPNTTQVAGSGRPPVLLGSLALEDDEAAMVVHMAMRQSVLRLGEILGDIQEDAARAAQEDISKVKDKNVDVAIDLMLRLLSRIPTNE